MSTQALSAQSPRSCQDSHKDLQNQRPKLIYVWQVKFEVHIFTLKDFVFITQAFRRLYKQLSVSSQEIKYWHYHFTDRNTKKIN